jgi:PAS domain S-box-containing protein
MPTTSKNGEQMNTDGADASGMRGLRDMIGYTVEELADMTLADVTHPEDAEIELALFGELLEGKRPAYQVEKRYIHKNEDIIWIRLTVSAARDENGDIEYLLGMVNITEAREKQDLMDAQVALIEGSPDFIAMANSEGRNTYISPTGLKLVGHDKWEGLGIEDMQPDMPPEILQTVISDGEWSGESTLTSSDGNIIPVSQFIGSIKNPDGSVRIFTTIARDITPQKEVEEQLRRAHEDLEQRVQDATDEIREQSDAIMEMSTPVIKLWDRIVLLPLIGAVDSGRAQQMIETLLQTIVDEEAVVAVLDVTGVPMIDTSVARNLLKAVDSARMLGVTSSSPDSVPVLHKPWRNSVWTSVRSRHAALCVLVSRKLSN